MKKLNFTVLLFLVAMITITGPQKAEAQPSVWCWADCTYIESPGTMYFPAILNDPDDLQSIDVCWECVDIECDECYPQCGSYDSWVLFSYIPYVDTYKMEDCGSMYVFLGDNYDTEPRMTYIYIGENDAYVTVYQEGLY